MHLNFALQFEPGYAAKIFAQDFFFYFELVIVAGVLIMAAAATREIRTGRGNARRRSLNDSVGAGTGKARLSLGKCRLNFLPRKHERDEYSLAAPPIVGRQACEAIPAVDQLFNGQEQESILRH